MPMSPTQVASFFLSEVPENILLDSAKCVIGAYAEAHQYVRDNYPGEEGHDLYPIVRRAMFERNWRIRLLRHKDVEVQAEHNAGSNCYHTRARVGRVVITASAVDRPSEMARDATFRRTLAQAAQLVLPGLPEVEEDDDGYLYAILIHGPLAAGILRSPAFLHVGFPTPDCKSYVERIDLAEQFPVLQPEIGIKPADIQRRKPRLRRQEDEKGS